MSFAIENISPHRVILRLNSGRTRHLSPRTKVSGMPASEVRGNAHIKRLQSRNAISVTPARRIRSTDLTAREVIAHIRDTPVENLEGFLADDEDRKTVQDAWDKKHDGR